MNSTDLTTALTCKVKAARKIVDASAAVVAIKGNGSCVDRRLWQLYEELTEDQRARAAYLFADDLFGADSAAYVYEVNARGEITGRRPHTHITHTGGRRPQIHARIIPLAEPHPTAEAMRLAEAALDRLAEIIVNAGIHQTQEIPA